MNLLAAFRRRADRAAPARPRRGPDWVDAVTAPPPAEDEGATAAPESWYESSWVLRTGASVIEQPAPELLALTPSSPPCR